MRYVIHKFPVSHSQMEIYYVYNNISNLSITVMEEYYFYIIIIEDMSKINKK